jgi:peptidoglycan/xylan/chitin deacetylase (PgdA/CDA1 family)
MLTRIVIAAVLFLVVVACGGDGDGGTATPAPSGTGTVSPPASGSATPAPSGGEPTIPPVGFTFVVQAGDTLFSIARRFGTTVEAIAEANGIEDTGQIRAGQALLIPGVSPTPAAPATATVTAVPSGGPAEVISLGYPRSNTIALTFDAGSDAGYTALILDVLAANGIHASFGMTGKFAETYPDLVQRIASEGHEFINHSYDHKSFTGRSTGAAPLSREERWEQLDRTESIVRDLTGKSTLPYFRPPYGDYDDSVNADVGARGYRYNIMWLLDSRGWLGIPAAEIVQRCLQNSQPGAIYIFHVGSASEDGPALQQIIDGLQAQGYALGTVSDVLTP